MITIARKAIALTLSVSLLISGLPFGVVEAAAQTFKTLTDADIHKQLTLQRDAIQESASVQRLRLEESNSIADIRGEALEIYLKLTEKKSESELKAQWKKQYGEWLKSEVNAGQKQIEAEYKKYEEIARANDTLDELTKWKAQAQVGLAAWEATAKTASDKSYEEAKNAPLSAQDKAALYKALKVEFAKLMKLYAQRPKEVKNFLFRLSPIFLSAELDGGNLLSSTGGQTLKKIYKSELLYSDEGEKTYADQCLQKSECELMSYALLSLSLLSTEEDKKFIYDFTAASMDKGSPLGFIEGVAALLALKGYTEIGRLIETGEKLESAFTSEDTMDPFMMIVDGFAVIRGNYLWKNSSKHKIKSNSGVSNAWTEVAGALAEEGSAESLELLRKYGVNKCILRNDKETAYPFKDIKYISCGGIKPFLAGALLANKQGAYDYSAPYRYAGSYMNASGRSVYVTHEQGRNNQAAAAAQTAAFKAYAKNQGLSVQEAVSLALINMGMGDLSEEEEYSLDRSLHNAYGKKISSKYNDYAVVDKARRAAKANRQERTNKFRTGALLINAALLLTFGITVVFRVGKLCATSYRVLVGIRTSSLGRLGYIRANLGAFQSARAFRTPLKTLAAKPTLPKPAQNILNVPFNKVTPKGDLRYAPQPLLKPEVVQPAQFNYTLVKPGVQPAQRQVLTAQTGAGNGGGASAPRVNARPAAPANEPLPGYHGRSSIPLQNGEGAPLRTRPGSGLNGHSAPKNSRKISSWQEFKANAKEKIVVGYAAARFMLTTPKGLAATGAMLPNASSAASVGPAFRAAPALTEVVATVKPGNIVTVLETSAAKTLPKVTPKPAAQLRAAPSNAAKIIHHIYSLAGITQVQPIWARTNEGAEFSMSNTKAVLGNIVTNAVVNPVKETFNFVTVGPQTRAMLLRQKNDRKQMSKIAKEAGLDADSYNGGQRVLPALLTISRLLEQNKKTEAKYAIADMVTQNPGSYETLSDGTVVTAPFSQAAHEGFEWLEGRHNIKPVIEYNENTGRMGYTGMEAGEAMAVEVPRETGKPKGIFNRMAADFERKVLFSTRAALLPEEPANIKNALSTLTTRVGYFGKNLLKTSLDKSAGLLANMSNSLNAQDSLTGRKPVSIVYNGEVYDLPEFAGEGEGPQYSAMKAWDTVHSNNSTAAELLSVLSMSVDDALKVKAVERLSAMDAFDYAEAGLPQKLQQVISDIQKPRVFTGSSVVVLDEAGFISNRDRFDSLQRERANIFAEAIFKSDNPSEELLLMLVSGASDPANTGHALDLLHEKLGNGKVKSLPQTLKAMEERVDASNAILARIKAPTEETKAMRTFTQEQAVNYGTAAGIPVDGLPNEVKETSVKTLQKIIGLASNLSLLDYSHETTRSHNVFKKVLPVYLRDSKGNLSAEPRVFLSLSNKVKIPKGFVAVLDETGQFKMVPQSMREVDSSHTGRKLFNAKSDKRHFEFNIGITKSEAVDLAYILELDKEIGALIPVGKKDMFSSFLTIHALVAGNDIGMSMASQFKFLSSAAGVWLLPVINGIGYITPKIASFFDKKFMNKMGYYKATMLSFGVLAAVSLGASVLLATVFAPQEASFWQSFMYFKIPESIGLAQSVVIAFPFMMAVLAGSVMNLSFQTMVNIYKDPVVRYSKSLNYATYKNASRLFVTVIPAIMSLALNKGVEFAAGLFKSDAPSLAGTAVEAAAAGLEVNFVVLLPIIAIAAALGMFTVFNSRLRTDGAKTAAAQEDPAKAKEYKLTDEQKKEVAAKFKNDIATIKEIKGIKTRVSLLYMAYAPVTFFIGAAVGSIFKGGVDYDGMNGGDISLMITSVNLLATLVMRIFGNKWISQRKATDNQLTGASMLIMAGTIAAMTVLPINNLAALMVPIIFYESIAIPGNLDSARMQNTITAMYNAKREAAKTDEEKQYLKAEEKEIGALGGRLFNAANSKGLYTILAAAAGYALMMDIPALRPFFDEVRGLVTNALPWLSAGEDPFITTSRLLLLTSVGFSAALLIKNASYLREAFELMAQLVKPVKITVRNINLNAVSAADLRLRAKDAPTLMTKIKKEELTPLKDIIIEQGIMAETKLTDILKRLTWTNNRLKALQELTEADQKPVLDGLIKEHKALVRTFGKMAANNNVSAPFATELGYLLKSARTQNLSYVPEGVYVAPENVDKFGALIYLRKEMRAIHGEILSSGNYAEAVEMYKPFYSYGVRIDKELQNYISKNPADAARAAEMQEEMARLGAAVAAHINKLQGR